MVACSYCQTEFDERHLFCPNCGKERETTNPSTPLPVFEDRNRELSDHAATELLCKDNLAFLRRFFTSRSMIGMILLLFASTAFSLTQTILHMLHAGDEPFHLGLGQGSPILSLLSFVISALPLIGLISVYVRAKRPYVFTGEGFRWIGQFAHINVWLYRAIGVLWVNVILISISMSFRYETIVFFALSILPLVTAIPTYCMFASLKELAETLSHAVDQDPLAVPPIPDRLLFWFKWLFLLDVGFLLVLSLMMAPFSSPPIRIEAFGVTLENLVAFLLQCVVIGYGWYFVKRYWLQVMIRKMK